MTPEEAQLVVSAGTIYYENMSSVILGCALNGKRIIVIIDVLLLLLSLGVYLLTFAIGMHNALWVSYLTTSMMCY